MNATQEENLRKLAKYLLTVPVENFCMYTYVAENILYQEQARKERYCDSAACALGWAAILFEDQLEPFLSPVTLASKGQVPSNFVEFEKMGDALFGLSTRKHLFCFSGSWDTAVDSKSTPRDAAARILYVVDDQPLRWNHGDPTRNWIKMQHKCNTYFNEVYSALGEE